ncbi:MAG: CPBP family intramembrane metalloprotease [Candidatus Kapabacteria bacterium]|nr:CPBP family intramembrane metalloprotease [Candidatus Kapabacteria bacterium]
METKSSNNKPLISFFIIAFILAWGLISVAIAKNYGWIDLEIPVEPFLIIGSWVPNIAAFLVLAIVLKRNGGITELLKGWLKFKVSAFWYIVTTFPLILAAMSIFIYKLLFGVAPVNDIMYDPVGLIALMIMITITGAMGEELGWRGFALPRLQSRTSALRASILLGLIWVLWHSPLWFAGIGFEEIPFLAYAIIGVSFTVLVTWACNNSRGSLLIASLFHLTLNVSVNIIENKALYILAFLFMALAVIVVLVYGYSKLSKASELPIDKNTYEWTS